MLTAPWSAVLLYCRRNFHVLPFRSLSGVTSLSYFPFLSNIQPISSYLLFASLIYSPLFVCFFRLFYWYLHQTSTSSKLIYLYFGPRNNKMSIDDNDFPTSNMKRKGPSCIFPQTRTNLRASYRNMHELITITVGAAEIRYRLHRNLLTSVSPFFKAALNIDFMVIDPEVDHAVNFPDEKPEIFDWFVQWLYTGTLLSPPQMKCPNLRDENINGVKESLEKPTRLGAWSSGKTFPNHWSLDDHHDGDLCNSAGSPRYFLLLNIYALADRLGATELSNHIIDTVARLSESTNSVPTPTDTWLLYGKCVSYHGHRHDRCPSLKTRSYPHSIPPALNLGTTSSTSSPTSSAISSPAFSPTPSPTSSSSSYPSPASTFPSKGQSNLSEPNKTFFNSSSAPHNSDVFNNSSNSDEDDDDLDICMSSTRSSSPLKTLILDLFAYKKTDSLLTKHVDDWHPSFLRDLAIRMKRPGKDIITRHDLVLFKPLHWGEAKACESCKAVIGPASHGLWISSSQNSINRNNVEEHASRRRNGPHGQIHGIRRGQHSGSGHSSADGAGTNKVQVSDNVSCTVCKRIYCAKCYAYAMDLIADQHRKDPSTMGGNVGKKSWLDESDQ